MTDGIAQASGRGVRWCIGAQTKSSHASVTSDVSQMKPVTDDVKRWKRMGIGGLGVIGIGGIALGVTFTDAIGRIGMVIIGKS